MVDYQDFLRTKLLTVPDVGFSPTREINTQLFPFQRRAVEWALRRGRAALFFECGLGKTAMQVTWADHVAERTGKPVLILAPLAVSGQTVREGAKFHVPIVYAKDASGVAGAGVHITNYERLDKFDARVFGGVVLDESSILKSYSGPTKQSLVDSFAATPFRLACTATPAPNDHVEIGNHAEFLGVMPSSQMLARWFINDTSLFGNYRLKGHAIEAFWDWVTSWARCAGKPSDLGDSDDGFDLPTLSTHEHIVTVDVTDSRGENLFRIPDMSATSFHRERRRTSSSRAARVAEIVSAEPSEQWLVWCDTDYDADELQRVLPDAVNVSGSSSQDAKESALLGFADGTVRTLITKPKLAGFGMNWQQCARVAFVGPSFSYESYYQAVRRVWRFGQKREVHIHICLAETEKSVWNIVKQKALGHEVLKREMFAAAIRAAEKSSNCVTYNPQMKAQLPSWLVGGKS